MVFTIFLATYMVSLSSPLVSTKIVFCQLLWLGIGDENGQEEDMFMTFISSLAFISTLPNILSRPLHKSVSTKKIPQGGAQWVMTQTFGEKVTFQYS